MYRKEFLARATLAAGFPVTRGMLDYCHRAGHVDKPPKRGGQGWYSQSHVEQMLAHLDERGRYVPAEVQELVVQAQEVGKSHRIATDIEGESDE